MKNILIAIAITLLSLNASAQTSPTEGVITHDFVPESEMMQDLLQMIANNMQYAKSIWYNCVEPNSKGEPCGFFRANSAGQNNEDGVRTNADFSMLCAFIYKYGMGKVTLPEGMTWNEIRDMAMKSLVFGYSTHKANKLKITSNNAHWGSTSRNDAVWESSLWAMSLAYSTHFLKGELTQKQMGYIYNMLKAECNYELERDVPTGFKGDTKAEENGWEVDVLAATLGLFPDDKLAKQWFERMRLFAINSYSHDKDAYNNTVIDTWYDNTTVADLYRGSNLYSDYTLQNHNYFHTSYQNVVIQELGEALLALKLMQPHENGKQVWTSNALMHNNDHVMNNVLKWLATADGELAMPNGNDWSMFLFDQITSYSTMACFARDCDALMLENMAYKYIKARQTTTSDGSWLLNSDIGPRRMGVEGHRVMMTYLMHLVMSTADLTPTAWDDFRAQHSEARILPCQNVVRAFSPQRFTCFSWSDGLKSYTGYFASNSADKNKIVVPYRANNTGNLLGWYTVNGKGTNATPVVKGHYELQGDGYVMNGELTTNDASLNNRFALYSTPGNALIYIDAVSALTSVTVQSEQGGMLAISTDELTRLQRTLYYDKDGEIGHRQLDGTQLTTFASDWVNIDNELGVVGRNGKKMAFGDRSANNSIFTAKLYPMYANEARSLKSGAVVDTRHLVYYSLIDAVTTAEMERLLQPLATHLPTGWNGLLCADPDGTHYLIVSHFRGATKEATLSGLRCPKGAPVFAAPTTLSADGSASLTVSLSTNRSFACPVTAFVQGVDAVAEQAGADSIYITAQTDGLARIWLAGEEGQVCLKAGERRLITPATLHEPDHISAPSHRPFAETGAYTLIGVRVGKSQRGIVIKDRHKFLK
ncbi:MAG: hypothetical protein HUK02_08640 [Bacteroidaceae bacterium]|nr:hypothetical protein [Bacteroidaceae bacterium]